MGLSIVFTTSLSWKYIINQHQKNYILIIKKDEKKLHLNQQNIKKKLIKVCAFII